uniref:Uncharacterized protein n=1 Tax=Plectus sambesii TaxID=2011161 RepID=A0A914W626_9BILA
MVATTIALVFFVALAVLSFEQVESGRVYYGNPLAKRFDLDLASEPQGGGKRRRLIGNDLPLHSYLRQRYLLPHLPWIRERKAFVSKEIRQSDQDRFNLY